MGAGHSPAPIDDILAKLRQTYGTVMDASPEALIVVPAFKQVQLYGATATASFTGTFTTGLGYFTHADVYVRVAGTVGTSPTLDLFVDSKLDGTNAINLGHATQITTIIGNVLRFTKIATTASESGAIGGDAGAGTIRNLSWGDDLRVRATLSGGTTAPAFDLTVWVNLHT